MSQTQIVPCPHCGANYPLPAEYLAQYGGQQTQCTQCQQPFPIPRLGEVVALPPAIPMATAAWPVAAVAGQPGVLGYRGVDQEQGALGVWRDGNRVVAAQNAVFPARCVKCNVPIDGPLISRKLYWHHPAVYIAILQPVIYIILALVLRKTGRVSVGLCRRHVVRRRLFIALGWSSLLVLIGFFILAGNSRTPGLFIIPGFVAFFVMVVIGVVQSRIVTPSKIDDRFLWLRGVGNAFASSLPQ